jgi:hypothetical protein
VNVSPRLLSKALLCLTASAQILVMLQLGCGGYNGGPLYFDRPLQKGEVATTLNIGLGTRGFFDSKGAVTNGNIGFSLGYGAGNGIELYAGLPFFGTRIVDTTRFGNSYRGIYLSPRAYSFNFGFALGLMDRPGPFRTDNALLVELQNTGYKKYWSDDSTDPIPQGILFRGMHTFGLNTVIDPSFDVIYEIHPHGTTNSDLNPRFGR